MIAELGILLVGYAAYKILKPNNKIKNTSPKEEESEPYNDIEVNYSATSNKYDENTVRQNQVVSSYIPSYQTSEKKAIYAYCSKCGKETEQCQYYGHNSIHNNNCIICNGGVGYEHECNECYHDQSSDDD